MIASFSLFVDLSLGLGLPALGVVVALTDERGGFAAGAVLSLLALLVLRRVVPGPTTPTMHDMIDIGPVEPEV